MLCHVPDTELLRLADTSVDELVEDISRYIRGRNERCEPFIWTKDGDTILAKADRKTISNTRH